jgi:hypothetical protein
MQNPLFQPKSNQREPIQFTKQIQEILNNTHSVFTPKIYNNLLKTETHYHFNLKSKSKQISNHSHDFRAQHIMGNTKLQREAKDFTS